MENGRPFSVGGGLRRLESPGCQRIDPHFHRQALPFWKTKHAVFKERFPVRNKGARHGRRGEINTQLHRRPWRGVGHGDSVDIGNQVLGYFQRFTRAGENHNLLVHALQVAVFPRQAAHVLDFPGLGKSFAVQHQRAVRDGFLDERAVVPALLALPDLRLYWHFIENQLQQAKRVYLQHTSQPHDGFQSRQFVCFALLASVSGLALAQQSADPPAVQSAPDFWAGHNRYAELTRGQHQQNYREQDTGGLTADGTLDTETGHQDQISAALRWQTAGGWLLNLQAQRETGATDYNGYLQSGNGSLTPLRTTSGNVASSYAAQLGYALNSATRAAVPQDWQLVPMVQVSRHHWQRNLAQYSETYRYSAWAAGAMLQWQARPGTVLELQALSGRTGSADVNVQALNFAARQPGGAMRQWHIAISQDLGQHCQCPIPQGLARAGALQQNHHCP